MNKSHQCREKLIALLETHSDKICLANEYLVNIRKAIGENRLDQLNRSLSDAQLPIDDIEQLEQQRHALLGDYGFSADSDGFKQCVAWCDNDAAQVSTLYRLLIENLVQLQHSIQVNSLLVNKGKDRVRRSIGILTGLGGAVNNKIYSSQGKAVLPAGARDIAIA